MLHRKVAGLKARAQESLDQNHLVFAVQHRILEDHNQVHVEVVGKQVEPREDHSLRDRGTKG